MAATSCAITHFLPGGTDGAYSIVTLYQHANDKHAGNHIS